MFINYFVKENIYNIVSQHNTGVAYMETANDLVKIYTPIVIITTKIQPIGEIKTK
jgi:hypothetical protein